MQRVGFILDEITSSWKISPREDEFCIHPDTKKVFTHEIYSHGTAAKHVLHVSARRGFSPLYNSAAGAPCSVPELDSEVPPLAPPAFLLICLTTTHRCLRALQRVGVGLAMVSWSEEQRLSRRVCPEIREGRTQTQVPAHELPQQLWLSKCEGQWSAKEVLDSWSSPIGQRRRVGVSWQRPSCSAWS